MLMSCCLQVFNGKATVKQLAQNWSISYVGNMIGTMIVIALMCGGAVFPHQAPGVLKMAMPKVGLTFQQVWVCSNHRLPEKLSFGEVKGLRPLGHL